MIHRDITVTVAVEALAARTVVSVEVADGSEPDRANVVRLVACHLSELWAELELVGTVERQDARRRA